MGCGTRVCCASCARGGPCEKVAHPHGALHHQHNVHHSLGNSCQSCARGGACSVGRCGCGAGCRGHCNHCFSGLPGFPQQLMLPTAWRQAPTYTTPAFPEVIWYEDEPWRGVRMVTTRSWNGQVRSRPVSYQNFGLTDDKWPNWLTHNPHTRGCFTGKPQQPAWASSCYPSTRCY